MIFEVVVGAERAVGRAGHPPDRSLVADQSPAAEDEGKIQFLFSQLLQMLDRHNRQVAAQAFVLLSDIDDEDHGAHFSEIGRVF